MNDMTIQATKERLFRQSICFVTPLEDRVRALLLGWTIVVAGICLIRVGFPPSPPAGWLSVSILVGPHLLILFSPFLAYRAANRLFPLGTAFTQPEIRLARVGAWRPLDALAAHDHKSFGPVGIMASLLLGLLLNVPVRTAEFMTGIPAMTGSAPEWGQMIYFAMASDLIAMNFLYTLCFFMALRRVPFFPRMLLLTWGLDILSQLAVAHYVSGAPLLPAPVAASIAPLLESNVKKVVISMTVWLPYLLLSERVNVTYRWRQPA